MDVQEIAEYLHEELPKVVGDELLAVGWYSKEKDPRTGSVYISEDFSEHEGRGSGVLETALLESLGHTAHEATHEEELLTTIRRYETIIDMDVHLDEFEGVVVAVSPSDGYLLDDVLGIIGEVITEPIGSSAER